MLDLSKHVTVGRLFWYAQLLRSDGDNPEYDRALAELVCDAAGLAHEDGKDRVLEIIRGPLLDEATMDALIECAGMRGKLIPKSPSMQVERGFVEGSDAYYCGVCGGV